MRGFVWTGCVGGHRVGSGCRWSRQEPPSFGEPPPERTKRRCHRRSAAHIQTKLPDNRRGVIAGRKPPFRFPAQSRPGVGPGFVERPSKPADPLEMGAERGAPPRPELLTRLPTHLQTPRELPTPVARHERNSAVHRAQPHVNAVRQEPHPGLPTPTMPADDTRKREPGEKDTQAAHPSGAARVAVTGRWSRFRGFA
jgi:hypothetical protein